MGVKCCLPGILIHICSVTDSLVSVKLLVMFWVVCAFFHMRKKCLFCVFYTFYWFILLSLVYVRWSYSHVCVGVYFRPRMCRSEDSLRGPWLPPSLKQVITTGNSRLSACEVLGILRPPLIPHLFRGVLELETYPLPLPHHAPLPQRAISQCRGSFILKLHLFLCIGVLPTCMSVWGARCPEVELQTAVSCFVDAGNWT